MKKTTWIIVLLVWLVSVIACQTVTPTPALHPTDAPVKATPRPKPTATDNRMMWRGCDIDKEYDSLIEYLEMIYNVSNESPSQRIDSIFSPLDVDSGCIAFNNPT